MKNVILKWMIIIVFCALPLTAIGQEPTRPRKIPVISEVRLHFSERTHPKFSKKDFQSFLFKRWGRQIGELLKTRIREKMRSEAYYLSKIDSLKMDYSPDSAEVALQYYIAPGMRFKLSDITFSLDSLYIEEFSEKIDDVCAMRRAQYFTADLQSGLFRDIVGQFENGGFPLCRVETESFDFDSLNRNETGVRLHLNIIPGDSVTLAGLVLSPKNDANIRYLERILHFKPGQPYRHKQILKFRDILNRRDFIKSAAIPQIMLNEDSLFYLYLEYEEAAATSFDGIVGYVPPPANDLSQDGYFTGLLNVGLINVLGTGRRLDVFWKKPVKESEEFKINYREPFVAGLPVHSSVGMYRLVRDTTYIEWEYELLNEIPLNENLNWQIKFYNRSVFPDSLASRQTRLPKTKAFHTEMGFRWDSRDNLLNPRRGALLSLLVDYGKQKNIGPEFLLAEDSLVGEISVTKLSAEMHLLFEVLKNQVFSADFNTVLIGQEGVKVQPPDMQWFGGAKSIRGYREDQFFADRVGWVNLEYRFLIGPRANIFVFNDLGYYSRKAPEKTSEFLAGYGVGLRFPAPLGVMQVDYGLARGLSFGEGKLHFRIINAF